MSELNDVSETPYNLPVSQQILQFAGNIVIWLCVGILVQWVLARSSSTVPALVLLENHFWNALGLIALFFTVLAFAFRDLTAFKILIRSSRFFALQILTTVFNLAVLVIGAKIYNASLTIEAHETAQTTTYSYFFSSWFLFYAILIVLAVLLYILRYTHVNVLRFSKLEYHPWLRLTVYCIILLLIALVGVFTF